MLGRIGKKLKYIIPLMLGWPHGITRKNRIVNEKIRNWYKASIEEKSRNIEDKKQSPV